MSGYLQKDARELVLTCSACNRQTDKTYWLAPAGNYALKNYCGPCAKGLELLDD